MAANASPHLLMKRAPSTSVDCCRNSGEDSRAWNMELLCVSVCSVVVNARPPTFKRTSASPLGSCISLLAFLRTRDAFHRASVACSSWMRCSMASTLAFRSTFDAFRADISFSTSDFTAFACARASCASRCSSIAMRDLNSSTCSASFTDASCSSPSSLFCAVKIWSLMLCSCSSRSLFLSLFSFSRLSHSLFLLFSQESRSSASLSFMSFAISSASLLVFCTVV
mmetsp:Transcript_2338/g.5548  ORF Transcript_2338/g.5548 Transcript_2338/m.5548 type:complete len:225 (-) Transcript_2338:516-1190(-)